MEAISQYTGVQLSLFTDYFLKCKAEDIPKRWNYHMKIQALVHGLKQIVLKKFGGHKEIQVFNNTKMNLR